MLEKLGTICKRMKLNPYHTQYIQINSKWKVLKVDLKLKLLEENIAGNITSFDLTVISWICTKAQASNIKILDYIKI